MKLQILADSCCDLPKNLIEKYEIDILPITVINQNVEYEDFFEITAKEVYQQMRNGVEFKTAQIPPQRFIEKFTEYAQNNIEAIYIAFSSELSGTYQSAIFARETVKEQYPNLSIEIIDSRAATLGCGMIALKAAEMVKNKSSKEDILDTVLKYIESMEHIFTVDDIEYLFKGGRVSRMQSLLGGMLNIKPVLHVEDGKLVAIEKARGKNKAYKFILEEIEKRIIDKNNIETIAIAHGDDEETALKIKTMLEDKFKVDNFLISQIGAAVGSHSGPGTIAIMFLNKKI